MDRKWDFRFLELAWVISQWSKDASTKVGAVIVDSNQRIVSTGFNGFSRGLNDSVGVESRNRKLLRTIHAESNALLFAHRSVQSCTIYVTHLPCASCCAKIIQSGITRIVVPFQDESFMVRWADDIAETRLMIAEAHIELDILEEQ